ncbi:hypothetical protein [Variovorax sp. LG9.2]|uniref:hypothetical protein n=1 Tax=Variovorax sp. LG9.2 TaxID=3048626 RepID=UPI002B221DEB|nr:hypothetical protein [Variovorax sp. LG9.2]MEB0058730.1 hypothetical protein [Variovorax sp. LG9.2]
MIKKYTRIGNVALVVTVVSLGIVMYVSANKLISEDARLPLIAVYVISLWTMFWAYARAKGRSGALGIALPFLNLIGLVILLCLKDLSNLPPDWACEKCKGKNLASDSTCRYCSAPQPS